MLERTTGRGRSAATHRRRRADVAGDDRAHPPGARCRATCCATPSTSSSPPIPTSRARRKRSSPYVRFGASPRGAQALILAGKVTALLDGRPNVSVDDVRAIAPAALRHRLVLGYEATADGVGADAARRRPARRRPRAGCRAARRARELLAALRQLLAPALLARLERLQLGTRRRLAGRFGGEHRSPRHGSSLDFADYREYHPGDDFRRIDYALYARTDQLFIRLFEAEDDLAAAAARRPLGVDGLPRQAAIRRPGSPAALGFVGLTRRDVGPLSNRSRPAGPARRFTGRERPVRAVRIRWPRCNPAAPTDLQRRGGGLLARPRPARADRRDLRSAQPVVGARPSTGCPDAAATSGDHPRARPRRARRPTCSATSTCADARPASSSRVSLSTRRQPTGSPRRAAAWLEDGSSALPPARDRLQPGPGRRTTSRRCCSRPGGTRGCSGELRLAVGPRRCSALADPGDRAAHPAAAPPGLDRQLDVPVAGSVERPVSAGRPVAEVAVESGARSPTARGRVLGRWPSPTRCGSAPPGWRSTPSSSSTPARRWPRSTATPIGWRRPWPTPSRLRDQLPPSGRSRASSSPDTGRGCVLTASDDRQAFNDALAHWSMLSEGRPISPGPSPSPRASRRTSAHRLRARLRRRV